MSFWIEKDTCERSALLSGMKHRSITDEIVSVARAQLSRGDTNRNLLVSLAEQVGPTIAPLSNHADVIVLIAYLPLLYLQGVIRLLCRGLPGKQT